MKQKIRYNNYSKIVTGGILLLFIAGIFYLAGNVEKLILFCIIPGMTTIAGLYFCPTYIEADDSCITLHRLFSSPKVFPYDAIDTIDACYPSAWGLRLCASGGYFGYWGYFQDAVIGYYFGYYGNRNNCILLKMKDGKQLVLGCDDALKLVSYVNARRTEN